MFIKAGFYKYKYKKSEKPKMEYLKNIKTVFDKHNREREVGEIDFLKIPCQELLKVLQDMRSINLRSEKKAGDYSFIPEELNEFSKTLKEEYKMYYGTDLFELLKEYLQVIEDTKKYETFAKILNLTCKLEYTDYDSHIYDEDPEYVHEKAPTQKEVDHNFVGDFNLTINKPIPMKVIGAMLKEVIAHRKTLENAETKRYDSKNSTEELDNLAELLF